VTASPISHQLHATSLSRALPVLGDWWTVLLIREAFVGVRLFSDFQSRLEIPRQTLTNRLRELVAQDLLYKRLYQDRPVRHEYRLTAKGLGLYPYALLLWKWQRRWGQQSPNPLPVRLTHTNCGQTMEPVFGCAHCHQPVGLRDVDWHARAPSDASRATAPATATATATATAIATATAAPAPRTTRHTVTRAVLDDARLYRHGAFVTADRWTHLILSCAFLGVTTFDGFERELGIAPNTLAQRLRVLVEARLFDKRPDADDSRRFQYRLTDRSRDLFPISMALVQWADAWMPASDGPPMQRVHRGCGHALRGVVMCSACSQPLAPREVRFEHTTAQVAEPA